MNTYKWVCKGCDSPNILVHDPETPGQMSLNCDNCGTAGTFEPKDKTVTLHYEKGEPFPTGLRIDTCSTAFYHTNPQVLDSSKELVSPAEYTRRYG